MHPLIHAFSYGFLKLLGGKEVVHFSCVTSVAHFFICMGYDFMNKVNERVRKIRKAAKLSQEKGGKLLGLKTSTYSQKEREGHVITMYRNLSKEKQKEIFAFVFNTFKNK